MVDSPLQSWNDRPETSKAATNAATYHLPNCISCSSRVAVCTLHARPGPALFSVDRAASSFSRLIIIIINELPSMRSSSSGGGGALHHWLADRSPRRQTIEFHRAPLARLLIETDRRQDGVRRHVTRPEIRLAASEDRTLEASANRIWLDAATSVAAYVTSSYAASMTSVADAKPWHQGL